MDAPAFVKLVEDELQRRGISKGKFYKESGISSATLSQWRCNIYSPSSENIRKIEDYLDISFEFEIDAKEKSATITGDGKSEILSIFSELNPSRQSKLLELARLYLADQRKNEEIQ